VDKPQTKVAVEKTEEEVTVSSKVLYVLSKRFWDGRVLHRVGDKLYFEKGAAPKGSTLFEEPAPEPDAAE
tara:strand:- start:357 stop:566 length:210 start_codon:yes stop_codon:yes gene_type:complete